MLARRRPLSIYGRAPLWWVRPLAESARPGEWGPCQHAPTPGLSAIPARAPREANREGRGLRPAKKGLAGPESRVQTSSTQGRPGRPEAGGNLPRSPEVPPTADPHGKACRRPRTWRRGRDGAGVGRCTRALWWGFQKMDRRRAVSLGRVNERKDIFLRMENGWKHKMDSGVWRR